MPGVQVPTLVTEIEFSFADGRPPRHIQPPVLTDSVLDPVVQSGLVYD